MNITITKFEDLNLYSNKNIEKLASTIIAESSNAVLVNMYEDGAVLLDHKEGQFYMCDYKFDAKNATFLFENFDPIELKREKTSFRDSVYNFFESDDVSHSSLFEEYKETIMSQDKFIQDIVSEAMSAIDFDEIVDYSELSEANKDVSIKNDKFFTYYKERLSTHPLTEAKIFNWKDPVKVSLVETERFSIVNTSAKEKAEKLWKNEAFKNGFSDAASSFVEDVEEGSDKFVALFEAYPQVFYLDKADKKTLFGKMLIGNATLREHRNDIIKGMNLLFENNDELVALSEQYLVEGAFEDAESMDFTDDKGKTEPTEKSKKEMLDLKKPEEADKPMELTPEELEKLASELVKVANKIKDEKVKAKLENLADKLSAGKEEGTRPSVVKESVELLSL